VNNRYATRTSNGRVFCMGDAIHRHPPSNGLGSNTSIQDAFNLAWKLALVLKGQAGERLLESYDEERAPIAKQIVTRANQSIAEFGPIFEALGMGEGVDPVQMQKNLNARTEGTEAGEHQREAIRKAIAFKKYEFDAHGIEMNQRYRSGAVVTDGQIEPAFTLDADLHYQPTTWPGARLPHTWVYRRDTGAEVSTLDLCGHGRFTLLTGLGGEAWLQAAAEVSQDLGLKIVTHVIGPRQTYIDHSGDWARASEIRDSGCLLVRPDQHVCWRSETVSPTPKAELMRVMRTILGR
jgi:2,4-dichlorophenol 6-monooxygenase